MRNRFLKPMVLLVDDDDLSSNVLQDFLEDDGFPVVHAIDGADAVRKMSEDVGIVILDYTMPKIDGLQASRLLATHPQGKHVPVILLSGMPSAYLRSQVRSTNVYAVLEKPIRMNELLAHINALVHMEHDSVHSTEDKETFEKELREECYRQKVIELKAHDTWYSIGFDFAGAEAEVSESNRETCASGTING